MKRFFIKVMRRAFLPVLPSKMKLPFRYWLHILEGRYEKKELQNLHRLSKDHNVAIDIGANTGLYSYKMSHHFDKVYSFEINKELTNELAAYNPGNIEIVNEGLSSKDGNAVLYIPVLNGIPLTGWGSLLPNNCPDTDKHIEKAVMIHPLDKFKITSVSFIKIDVEGHELEVLKGAMQTLLTNRPTILMEVRAHNLSEVVSLLSSIDYIEKKISDLVGTTNSTENHIFVPKEKDKLTLNADKIN